MKGLIKIFSDPPQKKLTRQKLRPSQKVLTHAKNADPRKKIDPRNPRKNYDQRNMLNYVKNNLSHVTHATHVKI